MITPEEVKKKQESLVPKGLYDIIDHLIVIDYRNGAAEVFLNEVKQQLEDNIEIDKRIMNIAIDTYRKHWDISNITDDGVIIGYTFHNPVEN